jgi:hypothetical protein
MVRICELVFCENIKEYWLIVDKADHPSSPLSPMQAPLVQKRLLGIALTFVMSGS